MTSQEFTDELKEYFWNEHKLMLFSPCEIAITAFLQKKNLIVVSKVEYESLVDFREKQYLKDLAHPEDFY
jgi:hypothetical protein